jgi:hypothetical protein
MTQRPVAVATLEDARDVILAALGLSADADLPVQEPRADGSMTITFPDGTVIEVERTTWWVLARAIGAPVNVLRAAEMGDSEAQQRILDAFNAQEAKR